MRVKLHRWWGPILSGAYGLGLITGYSFTGGYLTRPYTIWWPQLFVGRRSYVLFAPITSWGCVLRRHHWPTDLKVLNGYCGKCVPWPCCGSIEYDHLADCPENTE